MTPYTPTDLDFIRGNLNLYDKEIADRLNRTPAAINRVRQKLGIRKQVIWDNKKEQLIRDNLKLPDKIMASLLGCSIRQVQNRRVKMGVNKRS